MTKEQLDRAQNIIELLIDLEKSLSIKNNLLSDILKDESTGTGSYIDMKIPIKQAKEIIYAEIFDIKHRINELEIEFKQL